MTNLYHANQLTAYEVHGFINLEDYLKDIIFEEVGEIDINTLVDAYNNFCDENSYEKIYKNDEEFFRNCFSDVMEVIRATNFGEYNISDDFVRFDGYANVESFTEDELRMEIIHERPFMKYILDNIEDYNFIEVLEIIENQEEILKKAYELVKQGY